MFGPCTLERTIVYIDGFNLYYRALRGTPHKWLDIAKIGRDGGGGARGRFGGVLIGTVGSAGVLFLIEVPRE
jgi:hypothetical protein